MAAALALLYKGSALWLSPRAHAAPMVGAVVRSSLQSPTTDQVSMSSSYNTILGTDTANTLLGSSGADSIVALAGDDSVILGTSVNGDIVNLGDGNDQIQFIIDGTSTSVAGGNGNDSLFLTVGLTSSTISGG
ncbi:MAG: hypothetical protein EBZ76_10880, partial [Synechococcaceae bacterium WB9_2_170]|nr:hypothetical protein [Synechococcaceae bacterium WB9_2_170]